MTQPSQAVGQSSGDDHLQEEVEQPRQFPVEQLTPGGEVPGADIVEVWGFGSFPASDPPSNW